jgi:hypothetical protein
MTNNTIIKNLAAWIEDIKEAAMDDNCFSIAWFKDTENSPFAIIAGWMGDFSESYSDIFYISKSEPKYAMCVKIAVNDGPYAYTDFEAMDMPVDKFGNVDDTCIVLEQGDDSESLAAFLLCEWERISETYGEH